MMKESRQHSKGTIHNRVRVFDMILIIVAIINIISQIWKFNQCSIIEYLQSLLLNAGYVPSSIVTILSFIIVFSIAPD